MFWKFCEFFSKLVSVICLFVLTLKRQEEVRIFGKYLCMQFSQLSKENILGFRIYHIIWRFLRALIGSFGSDYSPLSSRKGRIAHRQFDQFPTIFRQTERKKSNFFVFERCTLKYLHTSVEVNNAKIYLAPPRLGQYSPPPG